MLGANHAPVSCDGGDSFAIVASTDQKQFGIRVFWVEVEGIAIGLASCQEAAPVGHKLHLQQESKVQWQFGSSILHIT